MIDSVVLITCKNGVIIGTGFIIDICETGRFIATCGHVVNNLGDGLLVEGLPVKVHFNGYKSGLDLAVLFVDSLDGMPLQLKPSKNSTTGTVIGYSRLLDKPKKEKIRGIKLKTDVTLKCSDGSDIGAIKLNTREQIDQGYSGSPIICEQSNTVLGIVNLKSGEDENWGLCISGLLDNYSVQFRSAEFNSNFLNKPGMSNISDLSKEKIGQDLKDRFSKSLKSYASQKTSWLEPKLHSQEDDSKFKDEKDTEIELASLIDNPVSTIIKGRQQYGLTSISNYLVHSAWQRNNAIWLRVEIQKLTPSLQAIINHFSTHLPSDELELSNVECIVIDEVSGNSTLVEKVIEIISHSFCHIPLIIMQTVFTTDQGQRSIVMPSNRVFKVHHVWPLNRVGIRKLVAEYNNNHYLAEESSVVSKVISDLTVLNIPRTVLNCLTILKIYEIEFDESPVNRTEMIRRVLNLLFNVDDVPHYKTRPDVKDCEFILGEFCEGLIRGKKFDFTRKYFIRVVNGICQTREIDVEVDVIFDVLYANNILTENQSSYRFKFNYWVFYFAAHRMHHSSTFATYILENMNYISYPELIEFYCGIDRQRNDALDTLSSDIAELRDLVNSKCDIPSGMNVYDSAHWDPNEEEISNAHQAIAENVQESNLPEVVKDHYADKNYDHARPINQTIDKVMDEYSILKLMKATNAGSRALRNSDYANTAKRHQLLKNIMEGWKSIMEVLLILSPMLAHKGNASLEGANFTLVGFSGSAEQKFYKIIQMIPTNIMDWYLDDTYSSKMAPLLYKFYDNEKSKMYKHVINLMLINKRPKGWFERIKEFILTENKNTYYLSDVCRELNHEYQYSFASKSDINNLRTLILMTLEKHHLGKRKPSEKSLKHTELQKNLPERDAKNLDI